MRVMIKRNEDIIMSEIVHLYLVDVCEYVHKIYRHLCYKRRPKSFSLSARWQQQGENCERLLLTTFNYDDSINDALARNEIF